MSRKTQYGWMTLGGLLCMFGVFLLLKVTEGGRATAQSAPLRATHVAKALGSLAALQESGKSAPPPPIFVPPPAQDSAAAAPPLPVEALTIPPPLPPDAKESAAKIEARPVDQVPVPAVEIALPPVAPPAPEPPVLKTAENKPTAAEPPSVPPITLPEPLPTAASVPAPASTDLRPTPAPAGDPLPPLQPVAPTVTAPEIRQVSLEPASVPSVKPTGLVEPPLAPAPGPVVNYSVRGNGESLRDIARRTLGTSERWAEVHRLNPTLKPEEMLAAGTSVKLPADACIHEEAAVHPLPTMRPHAPPAKPKVLMPLTGTFAVNLDDKSALLLPRAVRDQLGNCDTVLLSPGSDTCLWLTNTAHLDRLADRLEHSPAHEVDVRTFKRLYYAQTEKADVADDGRVRISDRLAQFAGLHQELILVGIDDHFELWDAATWRKYTQDKSATARAALARD